MSDELPERDGHVGQALGRHLDDLEPNVPWQGELLAFRQACYERVGDPRAGRAAAVHGHPGAVPLGGGRVPHAAVRAHAERRVPQHQHLPAPDLRPGAVPVGGRRVPHAHRVRDAVRPVAVRTGW